MCVQGQIMLGYQLRKSTGVFMEMVLHANRHLFDLAVLQ